MKKEVLKLINEVLSESNKDNIPTYNEDLFLREDLGMDSLMLAELTVKIEMIYGTDIFEDGLVLTVGQILEKLQKGDNNE